MTPQKKETHATRPERERAVLVGAAFGSTSTEEAEWSLDELAALADTAGADVVESVLQRRHVPHPASYIGRGKAKEIVDTAAALDADMLIFDDELTPAQGRNLEEIAGVNPLAERGLKIIDRTGLILDIFAQHARSAEGKLQVDLAQLNYRLPRLRGWGEVLSRMAGGIGTRRGPGETALETERRAILRRIGRVKKDLVQLERTRRLKRKQRVRTEIPVVALVGYTNAGKSTLLKRLTQTDVLVQDQLFSTLDPTTRRIELPGDASALLTDTVGFVRKLPHDLVEAFRSTLEEVKEATLLLHVVDAGRAPERQIDAVNQVLVEIGVAPKPTVLAMNKSDLIDGTEAERLRNRWPEAVLCSAATGDGIDRLLQALASALSGSRVEVRLLVPFERGDVVARLHELGEVTSEQYDEAGTELVTQLPKELVGEFSEYVAR